MINRSDKVSDTILALLPPTIAVTWVIADATTGLVAADRAVHINPPIIEIVHQSEASTPALHAPQRRTPVIACSLYNSAEANKAPQRLHGVPQSTMRRLCQAGLKLTVSLPRT
ncbi:MAG: hypothetical protein GKS02_09090 [Alphaproteobacteria bacterium]|nr:hypothetical protein [Alphaproteobacteria bacterium]